MSPVVSGGVAPFNGGTITEALEIAPEDLSVPSLRIVTSEEAEESPVLVMAGEQELLRLSALGLLNLLSTIPGTAFQVSPNGGSVAFQVMDDEDGLSVNGVTVTKASPLVRVSAPLNFGNDPILTVDKDGEPIFRIDGDGTVHIKTGQAVQSDL